MGKINKTDLVLKILYDWRAHNGMIPIIGSFIANKQELTIKELVPIVELFERTHFAVFQAVPKGADFNGAITQSGIDFVLTNSFSEPGISILKL